MRQDKKSFKPKFKYYRYENYSYRIEFDSDGIPIRGAILKSDGSWFLINFGWELIMKNNPAIPEIEAFRLAGLKPN